MITHLNPMARCDAIVEMLRVDLGAIHAERILEAEAANFLWEARVKERYLGQHLDVGFLLDDEEVEFSRMAVMSRLNGRWYAAVCLVDGDGIPADILWHRSFDQCWKALVEFDGAH